MNYEDIALQKGGPVPLYRQIAAAIRQAITHGSLAPGERLPPIRTLALYAQREPGDYLSGL